jgi:hypothetical protein
MNVTSISGKRQQEPEGLFAKLLQPDLKMTAALGGRTDAIVSIEDLRAQRGSLAILLSQSEDFRRALDDTNAVDCASLVDSAIASLSRALTGERGSAPWLPLMNELQRRAPSRSPLLALTHAIAIAQPALGARVSNLAIDGILSLDGAIACGRLQGMMASALPQLAKQVCDELAAMNPSGTRWGQIDYAALMDALHLALSDWAHARATSAEAARLSFVLAMLDKVVCRVSLPNPAWESLLLKIERAVGERFESSEVGALTPAFEVLLAAVPRFALMRAFRVEFSRLLSTGTSLANLLLVKLALNARPESELAEQFDELANPRALIDAGFKAEAADALRAQLMEGLRPLVERVELDWLAEAWQAFSTLGRLVEDFEAIDREARAAILSISQLLVEGAGDAASSARVQMQLTALLHEAIRIAATNSDPLRARAAYRRRVAGALDIERDPAIWRKHRQLSAALAQIEFRSPAVTPLMSRAAPLLLAVSEVVHALSIDASPVVEAANNIAPRVWQLGSLTAGDANVIRMLLVRAVKLQVRDSDAISMFERSLLAFLGWRGASFDLSQYRELLRSVSASPAMANANAVYLQALAALSERAPIVSVAVYLPQRMKAIAAAVVAAGPERYARTLVKGSDTGLPMSIEDAWNRGQSDLVFSMARLSYLYRQGSSNVERDMAFWWNTAVARYLTRLPTAFFTCALRLLFEELIAVFSSDEAQSVFRPIETLYERAFGASLREQPRLLPIVPTLPVYGIGWTKLFAHSPAPASRPIQEVVAALIAMTPTPLFDYAEATLTNSTSHGDQETVWQREAQLLFAALESRPLSELEKQWYAWMDQAIIELPASSIPIALALLQDGLSTMQQIAFGRRLLGSSAQLSLQIAAILRRYAGETSPANTGSDELVVPIRRLLAQFGVSLLSEPWSLCMLSVGQTFLQLPNALRPVLMRGGSEFWLALSEATAPICESIELAGLNRLVAQGMSMGQGLAAASGYVANTLLSTEPAFADSIDEELNWRSTVCGLLVCAATPDHAHCSGSMMLRRLVLSSPVIATFGSRDWAGLAQSLDGSFADHLDSAFQQKVEMRRSQVGASLMDIDRVGNEAPLESYYQWGAAFAGIQECQAHWQLAGVAARVDTQELAVTQSEAIIESMVRARVPASTIRRQLASTLSAFEDKAIPLRVAKRRLFGNRSYEIGADLARALRRVAWLNAISSVLELRREGTLTYEHLGMNHAEGAIATRFPALDGLIDPEFDKSIDPSLRAWIDAFIAIPLRRSLEAALLSQAANKLVQDIVASIAQALSKDVAAKLPSWYPAQLATELTAAGLGYLKRPAASSLQDFAKETLYPDRWFSASPAVAVVAQKAPYLASGSRAHSAQSLRQVA